MEFTSQMNTSANQKRVPEGRVAREIEKRTEHLPSDLFLWAAGGSIITSLTMYMLGRRQTALFVGQWAPTFLVLGTYNKMVKLLGHDQTSV